ncbi:MAG: acyl-CoA dehydrogenase [Gammaproteobacteria bacterium]|nr:acyl-CoA dehydrogenase [Gammaproteobacteria bacterium]
MTFLVWLIAIGALAFGLARATWSFAVWTIVIGGALLALTLSPFLGGIPAIILWVLFIPLALLNISSLRLSMLSKPMLAYVKRILPPMSQTERDAIEAGTAWWEAELFRGNPEWDQLLKHNVSELTVEEQAYLDGPVDELCAMIDDWEVTNDLNDLSPETWEYIKKNKFLGMIIPKKYGGLEFSAIAHSAVVMKISTRSGAAGVSVMVPNSLGPAELLLHYGTEEQKNHYLPRLAVGEEIPCFALTGPNAGSDAGAMTDTGVVCKGMHEGKEVLGLRLNWEKRYITLAPVATVLGLAFKAYDPDGLLGDQENLGITCALIPTTTPGVEIGNRHNPLNSAFQNGPNWGKDVFIPMDWIIGGQDQIGKGWRMLVECLSVGRGISLPALGSGAGKFASYMTGAYAAIRKQFNVPIGKFEGVEEALTRIGGLSYMMESGRRLTASAIDHGEKPSVVTAILKYHNTEGMRQVINDAMDVHGGRGICIGPSNYLARAYQSIPISITVEGANILTRSLIIFGQGAMRCHPHLIEEVTAASLDNKEEGLQRFDQALFKHLGYAVCNGARSFLYGLTRSRLAPSPIQGPTRGYFKRLARMSASYAFVSDFAMLFLGGGLKRKEKLSGRFADALSYMYLSSAVLKRFEDTGRPAEDLPFVEWSTKYCLYNVQRALDEILRNFPSKVVGLILRLIVFPTGKSLRYPNDEVGHEVAKRMIVPSETRDRLTEGVYKTTDPSDPIGCVQHAFHAVIAANEAEKKLKKARIKPSELGMPGNWLEDAVAQGIITQEEAKLVEVSHKATREAIMVDDFPPDKEIASQKTVKKTARKSTKKATKQAA